SDAGGGHHRRFARKPGDLLEVGGEVRGEEERDDHAAQFTRGTRAPPFLVHLARSRPARIDRIMRIAVPREAAAGERRVALVPESCKKLIQAGYEVAVETGAGSTAGFADDEYRAAGATLEPDAARLIASGDLILKVTAPSASEVAAMRAGAIYLGSLMPLRNLEAARALAAGQVTAFATDAIPRTTRAQSMDTLSSMANLGGYKGVLLAAATLDRYFPMLMTAAGMVKP